jgi:hypothetical protein
MLNIGNYIEVGTKERKSHENSWLNCYARIINNNAYNSHKYNFIVHLPMVIIK